MRIRAGNLVLVFRRIASVTLPAFYLLVFVNFLVFFSTGLIWGDASNGKIEGSKYFLGMHGHYTEVSDRVFRLDAMYAQWTMISFFVAVMTSLIFYIGEGHTSKAKFSHGANPNSGRQPK